MPRHDSQLVRDRLDQFPAVAVLGSRQAGKTALAGLIADKRPGVSLDVENMVDRAKLSDAALYLSGHENKLVVLDEVQRLPELFHTFRGIIDEARRRGMRDSGIVHMLLGLDDRDAVAGHPVAGGSWEGFVVENLLDSAPERVKAHFYRTAAGAEIDLVLEMPGQELWAVEVKRGRAPRLDRGFHHARADLRPQRSFVVHSGEDRYPLRDGIEAIGPAALAALLVAA